jgi:prepilin-type N-terminal cleavage/methylation domain-containing protein
MRERDVQKAGFTLIELLLVMVVIGVMTAIIAPRLRQRDQSVEWDTVIALGNRIMWTARERAYAEHDVHRVLFAQGKGDKADTVTIEHHVPDPEKPGSQRFAPIDAQGIDAVYSLPPSVRMRAAFVHGKEQFEEQRGKAWSLVQSDRLMSPVVLHMTMMRGAQEERKSLSLLPFAGRWMIQDGFIKPEKK